jgi:hypothetical protein
MLRILLLSITISFIPMQHSVAAERELLYATELNEELQLIVHKIRDLSQAVVPYSEISENTRYFVRIAPRAYVVTADNQLADNAILGTKPFVFLATPEGIYGKSLLDIYLDIGYEAEDIIQWQRDQDMVAIVFSYPDEINFHAGLDGELPSDWQHKIFVPTWKNIFALFHNLAAQASVEPQRKGEFAPFQLFFTSQAQKDFVLNFPPEGQNSIMNTEYAVLRSLNNSDWFYRRLLENKLSIFEHFRGNGRTLNELLDPLGKQAELGVREFVAPNRKLNTLTELAVIHLGKLTIRDGY